MENKLELSKKDIAERQLKEAIKLFFEERDPVSIHTLTHASLTILEDLLKKVNQQSPLKALIKPDKLSEFIKFSVKARNSFKHADKDPADSIVVPINSEL